MKNKIALALALSWLLFSMPAFATKITIVNMDSAGEGFNDATPATPVGGNAGTTIGAQRLKVFQYAAKIWSSVVNSKVEILVDSKFDPLTCTASSGVLGSAGPTALFRDFANAPLPNTYYTAALANALSGTDLSSSDDISATFNSNVGTTGCLQSSTWYYGLDGNAPSGSVDLLTVIEHELAHGLGFLTFVDLTTGQKFNSMNDAFMMHLEDYSLGETWNQMTDAQRLASTTDTGNLLWTGTHVTAAAGNYTAGINHGYFRMFAPNPEQSGSSVSHFDTALTPNELMEPIIHPGVGNTTLTKDLLMDIGWPTFSDFRPVIGDIADTKTTDPVQFVVTDYDDSVSGLTISVSSSNTAVIDSAHISVTGSGRLRTLHFTPLGSGTSTITVTVSDGKLSSSTHFQLTVVNTAPTISISSPQNNANYMNTDVITFTATASDAEDGNLSASVVWTSNIDGALGTGASLTTTLSPGAHTITAKVTDSGGLTRSATVTVNSYGDSDGDGLNDLWELTYFGNLSQTASGDPDGDGATNLYEFLHGTNPMDAAPKVFMALPTDGSSFATDAPVVLAAAATDKEDGVISDAITWISDKDGVLGTGSVITPYLSVGTHTITATVTDSAGDPPIHPPSVQIHVWVRNGDVNGDGTVDLRDELLLQQYLLGKTALGSDAVVRGDLYPPAGGDGKLTASDLLLLQRQVLAP